MIFFKMKKPDRRKFKSKVREKARRERERYYSAITVVVVKIILLVFLAVLLSVSINLFTTRFEDSSAPVKYGVPVLVVLFMIGLVYSIIRSIMEIAQTYKRKH